jgi:hypothetical protein
MPTVAHMANGIQNLSSWLLELHQTFLAHQLRAFGIANNESAKAMQKYYEDRIKLSEQLFNNFKLEGTTEDGHAFVFSHQEPGYQEKTIIDGAETFLD